MWQRLTRSRHLQSCPRREVDCTHDVGYLLFTAGHTNKYDVVKDTPARLRPPPSHLLGINPPPEVPPPVPLQQDQTKCSYRQGRPVRVLQPRSGHSSVPARSPAACQEHVEPLQEHQRNPGACPKPCMGQSRAQEHTPGPDEPTHESGNKAFLLRRLSAQGFQGRMGVEGPTLHTAWAVVPNSSSRPSNETEPALGRGRCCKA